MRPRPTHPPHPPTIVAAVITAALTIQAHAAPPDYTLVGSYAAPEGTFGIDPAGHVVSITPDGIIKRQTALNEGGYQPLATTTAQISEFGASFARVSPDGATLAVGDGNFGAGARVHLIDLAAIPASSTSVELGNFNAHWSDDHTLIVTGTDNTTFGPVVSAVNTDTLAVTTIIHNAGGASGGVTTNDGLLFVADGFNTDDGGNPTGNIRAFDLAATLAAPAPVGYSDGTLVADALSGTPLATDADGNLLAGGGDFFAGSNDFGYGAVIDADAIADALAGLGVAPDTAETRLSPAGTNAFYDIRFNHATGELLVIADNTIFRYAVPAPAVPALLVGAPLAACRRRRR